MRGLKYAIINSTLAYLGPGILEGCDSELKYSVHVELMYVIYQQITLANQAQADFVVDVGHDSSAKNRATSNSLRFFGTVRYLTRSSLIAGDVLVLVVTWRKTFPLWLQARKANISSPSVTTCLLRDGIALMNIRDRSYSYTFRIVVLHASVLSSNHGTGGMLIVMI